MPLLAMTLKKQRGPYVKNERAKLERDREKTLVELAKFAPDLVAKFRGIETQLEHMHSPPGERYRNLRGKPKRAFRECLAFEDRWLTKAELVEALYAEGFIDEADNGRQLTGDNIRLNIGRGHLVMRADNRIGLPEWLDEASK